MATRRLYAPFPQQRTTFSAKASASNVIYVVKRTGIFLAGATRQQVFLAGAVASQAKGEG